MKKIYIIIEWNGQYYDDAEISNHSAYSTRELAQIACDKLNKDNPFKNCFGKNVELYSVCEIDFA